MCQAPPQGLHEPATVQALANSNWFKPHPACTILLTRKKLGTRMSGHVPVHTMNKGQSSRSKPGPQLLGLRSVPTLSLSSLTPTCREDVLFLASALGTLRLFLFGPRGDLHGQVPMQPIGLGREAPPPTTPGSSSLPQGGQCQVESDRG